MPGNSSTFSPASVNWYSGQGWVGWAPRGIRGTPVQGLITAVPGSTIQNGLMITPQNVSHEPLRGGAMEEGAMMGGGLVEPRAGAMLSGQRLSAPTGNSLAQRAVTTHTMAPASILMGGNAAAENSLQGRHSFNAPIRARMGTTLGGQYAVGGAVGEFHGDAFKGPGGSRVPAGMNGARGPAFSRGGSMGGPTILPHGQQSASTPQGGGGVGNAGAGAAPSVGRAASPSVGPSGGGGGAGHGGAPH
jgi:hypothetical protein